MDRGSFLQACGLQYSVIVLDHASGCPIAARAEWDLSMKRRTLLQGAGAVVASAVAAHPWSARRAATTLRFIPQQDLVTLDPVTTFGTSPATTATWSSTPSTAWTAPSRHAQMVEGHRIEQDGRRWDLTLREGLRFHDGSRFSPATASPPCGAGQARPFAAHLCRPLRKLSAPDDRTIRFQLKQTVPLLADRAWQGLSAVLRDDAGALAVTDPFQQVPELIGSGPFRFKADERVPGDRTVYTRFEGYVPRKDGALTWTSGPKVVHYDRVEWRVIGDTSTATSALIAGGGRLAGIRLARPARPAEGREGRDHPCARHDGASSRCCGSTICSRPSQPGDPAGALGRDRSDRLHAGRRRRGRSQPVPRPPRLLLPRHPMASTDGLGPLDGPRDTAKVRADLKAAGYNGETVL